MGALKSDRCHNGHILSVENVYPKANGQRECKQCSRDRARESARKKGVKARRPPEGVESSPRPEGYFPTQAAANALRYEPFDD